MQKTMHKKSYYISYNNLLHQTYLQRCIAGYAQQKTCAELWKAAWLFDLLISNSKSFCWNEFIFLGKMHKNKNILNSVAKQLVSKRLWLGMCVKM